MLRSLIIGACLALALAACASTPQVANKPVASAKAVPPPGCVGDTATRIPVKDAQCAGFGNTYTQQDLQNTGQIYLDKSLRMLDPAIH